MKFRSAMAGLCAGALVLAACGGDDGDSDTTDASPTSEAGGDTTAAPGGAELTLWHTHNEQETETLQPTVDACAASTGNTVNVELVPFDEAQAKFKTAAQAGEAPDIMRSEIAWTAEFAELGYLASIKDLVTDDDLADYLPPALSYSQYKDDLWGIPQVTDAPGLYYNKALLEENGIEPPTTLEELKAAGIAFNDATGTPGLGSMMNGYWTQIFVWSFGGELLNADATEPMINSPEAVAGLEFYLSMAADGAMNADTDFANQYTNVTEAFKAGETAFLINGPWQSADILSGTAFADNPENLGVMAIPPGPDGAQGSPVGGHNWVVTADAADAGLREAAYAVIECLNSPENQATWASENNLLPTRQSVYSTEAVTSNPVLTGFGEQMSVARGRPVIPEGGAIYTDFDPNVQAAFQGEATAQEALDAVAEAWTSLLAD
jgi:arabinogalactan oligomer/maltooligosaccharide transport system substrate-binding protein